ncbi:hypothetical protein FRC06_007753 [Ceratobasidium sp. 370]|nr:hypothetical protein FRC06_007753 [Ceratobasidium sp. 370]
MSNPTIPQSTTGRIIANAPSRLPPPQRAANLRQRKSCPAIPCVRYKDPTHVALFQQALSALALARTVTVVCGSNLREDLNAASRLLNKQPADLAAVRGARIKASQVYSSITFDAPLARLAYGRVFTGMRINDRTTDVRQVHQLTKHLFSAGRLLRCYTQEVNGLHTRDCREMAGRVVEIHGTNTHLRCSRCGLRPAQPTADFDAQLLRDGRAPCRRCQLGRQARLLPDVLLPDEASKLWMDGTPSNWPAMEDVMCDVLLLLGPRLESKPTARLVRRLASLVHSQRRVVLHVGWRTPDRAVWGGHVDLHIESDVETWARLYLEESTRAGEPGSSRLQAEASRLAHAADGAVAHVIARLATAARDAEDRSPAEELKEKEVRPRKRVRFSF